MEKCPVLKMTAPAVVALLVFCTPGYRTLSQTSVNEAGTLKSYCEQNNLQSPEIAKADSLYAYANGQLQKGWGEEGYTKMDLAVLYYRIALSKREMSLTQKRYEEAERQLSDDENELATYKEVLREMKGGR